MDMPKPTAAFVGAVLLVLAAFAPFAARGAAAAEMPILVPITGPLALEGTSQQNGALLALKEAPPGVELKGTVSDTDTTPEVAVNALERAAASGRPIAVVASIFGPQILAMLPLAERYRLPLLTISGTAKVTELGNAYVFRFFPADTLVKWAQARYAVEELGKRRPALIYQTTAYGQSGEAVLLPALKTLGAPLVFEEGIDLAVKDMLPVLTRAKAARPDVLLLQLHAGPTALLVREAARMGLGLPIVAGSAMHQPSTAALVEPAELKGVCAETGSSPVSAESPQIKTWLAHYRAAFGGDPDAYALAQYDGVEMVEQAIAQGARTPAEVRDYLASKSYAGLATTYRSDGRGNMAHAAEIVCYDGKTRIPTVIKHYDRLDAAP
ncbi:MAG TPA: ABC transporter substrate-binding protein [Alphaproteobacteria bacterium]|nr:ABC transporter substrate-binding protein [Alphaproteobacteria bacterium]